MSDPLHWADNWPWLAAATNAVTTTLPDWMKGALRDLAMAGLAAAAALFVGFKVLENDVHNLRQSVVELKDADVKFRERDEALTLLIGTMRDERLKQIEVIKEEIGALRLKAEEQRVRQSIMEEHLREIRRR